jgi:hypothetical protein
LELESATSNYVEIASTGAYSFGQCYLAAGTGSRTRMYYLDKLQRWHINFEQSEFIELSTGDCGAQVLTEGRFYYQKDMLSPDATTILPKSPDFVKWADTVFRAAKKQLKYSRQLEAYIGSQTEVWRQQGGKLVDRFWSSRKPRAVIETIQ